MNQKIEFSASDPEDAINGNIESAKRLLLMANALCTKVEEFRVEQPQLAEHLARCLPHWPANVGRHIAAQNKIKPILDELHLGEGHPARALMAPTRKGSDLDLPINAVAVEIWERIIHNRQPGSNSKSDLNEFHELQKFSMDNFSDWWKLGWTHFLKSSGGDPFNDERLKREKIRIEGVASQRGQTADARVASEIRSAAKRLWPKMAGLSA
jgi:hypothetical protein